MKKTFDDIYFGVLEEAGLINGITQGIGQAAVGTVKALARNAGDIARQANPNKTAGASLMNIAKTGIQSLKNLSKYGKPLDIQKMKNNPNSYLNAKIYKYFSTKSEEVITAQITDVSKFKTSNLFTAKLLDSNYIIIVSSDKNISDPASKNQNKEYIVKKDYFTNLKSMFNKHMKDFYKENNINIKNIKKLNIKNLTTNLNKHQTDLRNVNLNIQQSTKQVNIKNNNYITKSDLESQIKDTQNNIEELKRVNTEVKSFMSKNLNYLQKNTFTVTSDELGDWVYASIL